MPNPTNCLACQYRSQRMFCGFAPRVLADFNSIGTLAMLPAGATLIREGYPSDRVLVICSGQAMLSCNSSDGRTLNVRVALPGDVVGLSAAVSGTVSEATAVTLMPTFAKAISRSQFIGFLGRHGEASLHAAQLLAQDYRSSFQGARRLALTGSVAGRLAGLLLDWGRSASHGKSEMAFKMVFSQSDIAGFTGTTRETISRTLGKFQRKDLIRISGATVQILAEAKLASLVG
jgi:CRP/FNR family transcriptional regulator